MIRIIAITGGSGAGKTTLAHALAQHLDAPVLSEDDYYRCATTIAGFDAATHNFDAPDAKDHALLIEHLTAARRGEAFERPVYDLVTHRRLAHTERVDSTEVLVVEGIHLLAHPPLRALFDLTVFVEADETLRLGRRMVRDVEARGRSPREVLAQFFANVHPMHEKHVAPQRAHADIVLHANHGDDGALLEAHVKRIATAIGLPA